MRILFVSGLLILAVYAFSHHKAPGVGVAASPDQIALATPRRYIPPASAQTIAARFEANEVAAERDYKDKVGAISGVVTDIGVDFLGTPYIILDGNAPPYGVQCGFDRNQRTAIAATHKGETVTIQGAFGRKVMRVQMSDCVFEH